MQRLGRIDTRTAAQAAQMDAVADRWIESTLRTGAARRRAFLQASRRSYGLAGLAWQGGAATRPVRPMVEEAGDEPVD